MPFIVIAALLIPLPFFFDLSYFELVYSEEPFGHEARFPLPFGAFSFAVIMFTFYVGSKLYSSRFQLLLPSKSRFFLLSMVLYLVFHGYFFSGLGYVRLTQILLPLLAFLMLALPRGDRELKIFFLSGLLSLMSFTLFHFLSLALYSVDFLQVTSLEFPMFFGMSIYQSLVSYPAVLSMYFTVILFFYLSSRESYLIRMFSLISLITILTLILLSSRKSVFIELALALIMLLFLPPFFIKIKMSLERWCLNLACLLVGTLLVFYLVSATPSLERLTDSFSENTFTGGRLEIFSVGLSVISSDLLGFLVGFGGGTYSFHNFFIDLVFRLGLIATSVYLFSLFFAGYSFYRKVISYGVTLRVFCFFCLAGQLAIQLMVNSPLTQPFYVVNLLFLLFFVMYYPLNNKS